MWTAAEIVVVEGVVVVESVILIDEMVIINTRNENGKSFGMMGFGFGILFIMMGGEDEFGLRNKFINLTTKSLYCFCRK